MKVRKIIRIIAAVVLLCGIGMLVYPTISNWLYQRNVKEMESEFIQGLTEGSEVPYANLLQACIDYNNDLSENGQFDLGTEFEEAVVDLAAYGIEDGIIGYIEIPKMDVTLPIYLGSTTENMSKGAVQLGGTSLPIGSYDGASVNTVIAAHRGYNSKSAMFREIQKLEVGDEIIITNLWGTLIYQVVGTEIIVPSQVSEVAIQEGKDMITLSTCHPYRHNYQRYLVYCERVS